MRATFTFVASLCVAISCAATVWSSPVDFPRDVGSHPEFTNEWWYLTGWLDSGGEARGFQITFFRVRNAAAESNPSKFAPKQILFAHAALSDPSIGRLMRAEKTARIGFGLAEADASRLNVHLDDWSFEGDHEAFSATVKAENFDIRLQLRETQPPLLQGHDGVSQKGPERDARSFYYSQPQLALTGSIRIGARDLEVTGQAWFDHEWSNRYVDERSVGWDWIGLNLADGDAVMSFRMRDRAEQQRWADGKWRSGSKHESFEPNQIRWVPLRRWRSPRTGVEYPIAWRVTLGSRTLVLRPLFDDQENDARGSVGILYWEGAVSVTDEAGAPKGRGYLELTGYGEPVRL